MVDIPVPVSDLIERCDAVSRNKEDIQRKIARLKMQGGGNHADKIRHLEYQLSAVERGSQRLGERLAGDMRMS